MAAIRRTSACVAGVLSALVGACLPTDANVHYSVIQGQVLDAGGSGVANASIILDRAGTAQPGDTRTTASDGGFRFESVPSGHTYGIQIVPPSGYVVSAGQPSKVTGYISADTFTAIWVVEPTKQ